VIVIQFAAAWPQTFQRMSSYGIKLEKQWNSIVCWPSCGGGRSRELAIYTETNLASSFHDKSLKQCKLWFWSYISVVAGQNVLPLLGLKLSAVWVGSASWTWSWLSAKRALMWNGFAISLFISVAPCLIVLCYKCWCNANVQKSLSY
jgi:hypothetical protein